MEKVKLILFDTKNLIDFNIPYIDEAELVKINRYKQLNDKKTHLISMYFKKKYIKSFYIDDKGKPRSKEVFFNISHSNSLVGIAISNNNEIGLDIEYKNNHNVKDLINYVCNNDEKQFINEDNDFYKIWVSKESFLKCIGTGITNNLKEVNSLPIDGKKNNYYSHYIDFDDYAISITLENIDFEIDIIKEKIGD